MSARGGFFGRFRSGADEDETRLYSPEEIGEAEAASTPEPEEEAPGFTVEKAVRIVEDLPPDVSPESALRIVRKTLLAAGVDLADLERQSRARETRLSSEMKLARGRRDDLTRRTDEVLGSLEEEARKAREACDTGVAVEEERISRARQDLVRVRRVRDFFGFPEVEAPEEEDGGDETQVLEMPLMGPAAGDAPDTSPADETDPDETRVIPQSARGPLSEEGDAGGRETGGSG
jgi:hypothetical protein